MKSLIASIMILGLVGMVVGITVQGANEASVAATVTVQNISVTVSDGTVAYGTMSAGASRSTALNDGDAIDDSQTATNDGNVTETLNIRGSDSAAWTLSATASGAANYAHKFCTATCDTAPTWTALNLVNQTLASGVAATGSQIFDLQITTPPSAANYTQQSVNVTVQATL